MVKDEGSSGFHLPKRLLTAPSSAAPSCVPCCRGTAGMAQFPQGTALASFSSFFSVPQHLFKARLIPYTVLQSDCHTQLCRPNESGYVPYA